MAYLGTPIDTRNQFQSLSSKQFNGDGSTTDFTLDIAPGSVNDIEVFVGNVRQDPHSAYTLSGTTLTFTGAPPSGTNNIYVVHQAKSVGTINAPDNSVDSAQLNTALLTGATDIGADIADADLFLIDDGAGGTLRKTAASRIKTYVGGFDVTSITGATALAEQPAATDEIVLSDAGTLKRADIKHISMTPAFFAYLSSNQNPSQNVYTKVTFDTEDVDSDGTYDNSTNYRFTPAVAGKYLVFAQIETYGSNVSNLNYNNTRIMKNGSEYMTASPDHRNNMPYGALCTVQAIMTLDDNDYVEIFARAHDQGDSTLTFSGNGGRPCFFGAYRITGIVS